MSDKTVDPKVLEAFFALNKLVQDIKESVKPNDRSEQDRRFAILITELEKVQAYYSHFIIGY